MKMSEIRLDLCRFEGGFVPAETSPSFRRSLLLRERRVSHGSSGFNLVLTESVSSYAAFVCQMM